MKIKLDFYKSKLISFVGCCLKELIAEIIMNLLTLGLLKFIDDYKVRRFYIILFKNNKKSVDTLLCPQKVYINFLPCSACDYYCLL